MRTNDILSLNVLLPCLPDLLLTCILSTFDLIEHPLVSSILEILSINFCIAIIIMHKASIDDLLKRNYSKKIDVWYL